MASTVRAGSRPWGLANLGGFPPPAPKADLWGGGTLRAGGARGQADPALSLLISSRDLPPRLAGAPGRHNLQPLPELRILRRVPELVDRAALGPLADEGPQRIRLDDRRWRGVEVIRLPRLLRQRSVGPRLRGRRLRRPLGGGSPE
jgi:hypothetical protein